MKLQTNFKAASSTVRLLVTVMLATLLLSVPLQAQEPVAIVNGEAIEHNDFYNELLAQAGNQVLSNMIQTTLIRQASAEQGIQVSGEQLQQEIDAIRSQFPSDQAYQEALRQANLTEELFLENLEIEILLWELVGGDIQITTEDVRAMYEEQKAQFGNASFEEVAPLLQQSLEDQLFQEAVVDWVNTQWEQADIEIVLDELDDM